ncbi:aminomethyl-transferring glycine dehydrogenase subunit GcvPA [Virgibacillus salexigens]|uniref:Probable glycine dehydrogenase (decarboxylating) subunit 1 n=2 Tax=Virgibacillus TaxID=84406 RepID=A0A024QBU5_9BACI|nr:MULTISPECIES: aminomethyl-transferring glycine dehydrogenase subunit GcvPA [Virgibacillus]MYL41850.1 aminomethyl-transferring glycine dehydrogenase subunit GcvPA [Virgibacillus massiliensis]GGJ47568.1 putative glycine dehydrogenase (decarboxylating) subunit 1 [Virgibacillus kapii]CDQ39680.1 putative glycine dehydrogenase [decarboxylating] subunit 1 [Virgibacillus massiliensis]
MEFRYLPMTVEDKQEMLASIGIDSTDALFSDIPKSVRLKTEMQLKKPANEAELKRELATLASKNANLNDYRSFLGAGVYDHFIPSVVDHVISRSEFYTAYTPYQPEISQGELQAIFEFQTMISELTGMDVANSSMYDGGTSLAEAVNLSAAQTKRKKILVSKAVHPQSRAVIDTYAKGPNLEIVEIDVQNGKTDMNQLANELDEQTASVVVQYPNFFGQLESMEEIQELLVNQKKTMFIVSSNPLALGYLTPPGDFGADIVVGDTQVFGIPAQFGGPHCGYFATTKKLMRKVPGRLVGQTTDEEGVRGFVLTLQAREQHIRRDKATSNICSNQALNALASSVAMSSLGKHGLKQMAAINMKKARYAKQKFQEAGMEVVYNGSFFNEFVIKLNKSIADLNDQLLDIGIIGGYNLEKDFPEMTGHMLVAVTENRTIEDIDQFVREMRELNV